MAAACTAAAAAASSDARGKLLVPEPRPGPIRRYPLNSARAAQPIGRHDDDWADYADP